MYVCMYKQVVICLTLLTKYAKYTREIRSNLFLQGYFVVLSVYIVTTLCIINQRTGAFSIYFILVFFSLCATGSVRLKINGWVNVSFCLPHKVHNLNQGSIHIKVSFLQSRSFSQ